MDITLIITYPISSNFSKKNFPQPLPCSQPYHTPSCIMKLALIFVFCVFFYDFLFFSVWIEKWNKNEEYPGGIWIYFSALANEWFFWRETDAT